MEDSPPYTSKMVERIFGEYINQNQHLLEKYKKTIQIYTGTYYEKMNKLKRDKTGFIIANLKRLRSISETRHTLRETKEHNKTLEEFFNELPPFIPTTHLTLYRYENKKKIKDSYEDKAFQSVSTNIYNTFRKIRSDKYIPLRIHLLPGVEYKLFPIYKISLVPEEDEILFAPGVKYYRCNHPINYGFRVDEGTIEDYILIPNNPKYTKLLEHGWRQKWTNMITEEEAYLFKEINEKMLVSPSTNDYEGKISINMNVLQFIQEMEYLIQEYIGQIHEYNEENTFPDIGDKIHAIYNNYLSRVHPDSYGFTGYKITLDSYLDAWKESILSKEGVPKILFKQRGEWMNALGLTHHLGGGGSRNTVAPAVSPDLTNLLMHIIKDASVNAMLNEWIKKISDFLQHYGIPIDKVFALPPWFYEINICGYKPIHRAEDLLNTYAFIGTTQREKMTLIYRFAMKFSGLLWHHVINGDGITQLPFFMNKEVLNRRMVHILEKYDKQPNYSPDGFSANKRLLKEKVYEDDRNLKKIYREFTLPNTVPPEEVYKNDRVPQTNAHYIHKNQLLEPLSVSEVQVLKNPSLLKRSVTAIRLRNMRSIDELPWITGSALYKIKKGGDFAKLAESNRKEVLTGPSGSAQLMLEFAKMFNMDERIVVLALIPWMYIHKDHSIFEILLVANNYIGSYDLKEEDQAYIKGLATTPARAGGVIVKSLSSSRPVSAAHAAPPSSSRHTRPVSAARKPTSSYTPKLASAIHQLHSILKEAPPSDEMSAAVRDELKVTRSLMERIGQPAVTTSDDPMAIQAFMAYKFPDMGGIDYAEIFDMKKPYTL